jgi:hypothetical protein
MKLLILRAIPFLLVLVIGSEIFIRFFVYDSVYRDAACNRNFLPKTDTELRRLFYPGCHDEVSTPDGRTFSIDTNEDGFRDRGRAAYGGGAVAVLGDSHAEGFALPIEDSLSRQLEKTGAFDYPLLNIGYRATGPDEQLRILTYAKARYDIKGLVWVLTENDILDDLYLRTRDPGYWATRLNIFFLRLSNEVFARKYLTLEYLRVVMNGIALSHAAHEHAELPMEKIFCENVRKALPVIGAGVPLTVVAIPHGALGRELPYFGTRLNRAAFWKSMECIGQPPITVIDQREEFSALSGHFMADQYHLDAEGTRLWAKAIASAYSARKSSSLSDKPRAKASAPAALR